MVYPTAPERAWSTWRADQPAAMLHLPSGFTVGVAAFSGRHSRWYGLGPDAPVELGRHALDGSLVELAAVLDGTTLAVAYRKPDPWTVVGTVRVTDLAELPLRFWVLVWCGFPPRAGDEEAGALDAGDRPPDPLEDVAVTATWRSQHFALLTDHRPVAAGRHADVAAAGRELEAQGYMRAPAWEPHGAVVVLRFNAELTRELRVCAAQATDATGARAAAHAALGGTRRADNGDGAEPDALPAAADGLLAASAADDVEAAIRDVLAWNTVWDGDNHRWYTALSRRWVTGRFGGWLLWLDDCLYHALMAARVGDADLAEHNLEAALHAQQPAGNLPCLLSKHTEWVDRSHPPIGSWVLWRIWLLTGNTSLLRSAYPVLLRWHEWWYAHRDGNGNGILEYGSSPTGRGLYVHTHFAARNESAMDNSPMFEGSQFDSDRHTLDVEEVGLNSLLVLDAEMLANAAAVLGRPDDAAALRRRAERQAATVREHFWDDARGVFAGRRWDGRFVEHVTPTSFFPLTAGIASREQADRMIREHLLDERRFWGRHPVPATPHDDPTSEDDTYWRGRVWPPLNLLVHEGLRRYGYRDEARALAERGWQLFRGPWEDGRRSMENYHRHDPTAHAGPDVDSFYTWGALLPMVHLLDRADANPWSGICIEPGMRLPAAGDAVAFVTDGAAGTLVRSRCPRVRIAPATPLEDVRLSEAHASFVVSAAAEPIDVALVDDRGCFVVAWYVDGRQAGVAGQPSITVTASDGGARVELLVRPHDQTPESPRRWMTASGG